MKSSDAVLARVAQIIADVFHPPEGTVVTRETTANDIDGWDSLSHTTLIMQVEEAFGIELPIEGLYALRDVGELADLVVRTGARSHTVFVYGNCQAEGFAQVLGAIAPIAKKYRVVYVPSYDRPGGSEAVEQDDVEACDVLFQQYDPRPFPYAQWLREECRRVTFPSLDFNLLWPYSRPNPYNDPEPPDFPHGVFPYGHGVVVSWIERGLGAEEVLAAVLAEPVGAHRPNLDRLLKLEIERLRQRDASCDVGIAAFVSENFRSKRLFWATNHPTNELFAELCTRLVAAAFPEVPTLAQADLLDVLTSFGTIDLLGAISIPIDPWVARHFELSWYDAAEAYRLFNDERVTYVEYYRRMIATSLAAKVRREQPLESVEVRVE
ncbi:MAG: hypothetical protein JO199_02950 [Candidatus Eremiobacteraeota bacterium]|nr:hypothetical protein [Candidatus Eremiobacteraeota bacterium]